MPKHYFILVARPVRETAWSYYAHSKIKLHRIRMTEVAHRS